MKKKKLLSLVLASVLALTSVSAIACTDNTPDTPPGHGGTCTHVDEAPKDHTCDLCGETGIGEHADYTLDGKCDYCGATIGSQGPNQGGMTRLTLGGFYADETQSSSYQDMIFEFNSNYGMLKKISVEAPLKASTEYENELTTMLNSSNGWDLFMVSDRKFKSWVQQYNDGIRNIGDLTSRASFQDQLSTMWKGMIDRFRLNVEGWTSYEDDDLWAVPVDSNPTALYYNRTVLEKNGIIVISVEDTEVTEDNYAELCESYKGILKTDESGNPLDANGNKTNDPKNYVYLGGGLSDVPLSEAAGHTLLELWNQDKITDLFGSYHNNLKFVTADENNTIENYYYATKADTDLRISADWLDGEEIPARGFYRSESPREYIPGESGVTSFVAPGEYETLVFNASIAMSWDEMEDIAMLCTKSDPTLNIQYNDNSASTYGFYTQWWFAYGWSVGGDCIEDMTGKGDWAFSLSDYSANYMVTEDACKTRKENSADDTLYYKGAYTGTYYSAGQTLSFLDKMAVEPLVYSPDGNAISGDVVVPTKNGGFQISKVTSGQIGALQPLGSEPNDGTNTTNTAIRNEVLSHASQEIGATVNGEPAWFIELPSTKDAFTRFALLCPNQADDSALYVSYPVATTSDPMADIKSLANNKVAFVIERGDRLGSLRKTAKEYDTEWGVANTPIFKEYNDDGSVKRMGVQAGHSECVALGITAGCDDDKVEAAWEFIQWMTADYWCVTPDGETYFGEKRNEADTQYDAGQAIKARTGFIPNQESLFRGEGITADTFIKPTEITKNLQIFAYAIDYEGAGDWWYLPNGDSTWINEWASPLNNEVRGGTMTVSDWFQDNIIPATNKILNESFNYYGATIKDANINTVWRNALSAA